MSKKSFKVDKSIVVRPQTSPPADAEVGEMYFDSTLKTHKIFNGSTWDFFGTPPGSMNAFAGTAAPAGWLICDGSAVSRTTYAGLFSIIGTIHGSGDGTTTFNLPDARGSFLRGAINIPAVTGTGTASSNQATFTSHGFSTGMRIRMTAGALTGLAVGTNYYAIVIDQNILAFASSQANALSNTRIAISGANTAVIQQWVDPDATSRVSSRIGANTGSSVGSFQEDRLGSHTHVQRIWAANANGGPVPVGFANVTTEQTGSYSTLATGGNQTAPINLYVNYIIKY